MARAYFPASTGNAAEAQNQTADLEPWFVERLARGEVAAISRSEEHPREAIAAREQTRLTESCSLLGLPTSVAGRVICALVIDSARWPRRWPQPLVERLQLLSAILGAALLRPRLDNALRSTVGHERPTRGDNVYLKDEIQSYHDFDDIVGESAPLRLALTRLAQAAR